MIKAFKIYNPIFCFLYLIFLIKLCYHHSVSKKAHNRKAPSLYVLHYIILCYVIIIFLNTFLDTGNFWRSDSGTSCKKIRWKNLDWFKTTSCNQQYRYDNTSNNPNIRPTNFARSVVVVRSELHAINLAANYSLKEIMCVLFGFIFFFIQSFTIQCVCFCFVFCLFVCFLFLFLFCFVLFCFVVVVCFVLFFIAYLKDLMPITFSSPRAQLEEVYFLISNESPYLSNCKSKISASYSL